MKVRQALPADLAGYAEIQAEEWGGSMAASHRQLEVRHDVFPAGLLAGIADGEVVGGFSFHRLDHYDLAEHLSWNDLTDDGWCTNHDDDGPILFGVDLTVSRRAPRAGSATMFVAGMELAMRLGVEAVVWGSRIPRYHRYADRMSAEEYVAARNPRGRHLDPEIEIYSRVPGVEVLGVVPEYFKDWESADYGVVLRWPNPIRRYPFLRPWSRRIIGTLQARHRRRNR